MVALSASFSLSVSLLSLPADEIILNNKNSEDEDAAEDDKR